MLVSLRAIHPFVNKRVDDKRRNARRSFAGTQEEEALFGKRFLLDAKRRVHARKRHGGRTLDVVIEAEDLFLVAVQQLERVVVAEVFELNKHVRPATAHFLNELFNERRIAFARDAFVAQAR